MAALTGNSVASSYQGLIKFNDNGTVQPTTLKALSDGTGGSLPLSMSQVETKFTPGTVVDLTGVTVNGLSGGAGLVDGTGLDSMRSDLTSNVAVASGPKSIALGWNADATGNESVSIGAGSDATTNGSCAIGPDTHALGLNGLAIGFGTYAQATRSIAFGYLSRANADAENGIAIGNNAQSRANNCITIGANAIVDDSIRVNTVVLGSNAKAAQYSTAIGADATAVGQASIAIGDANAAVNYGVVIGDQANSSAGGNDGTIAIGKNANAGSNKSVAIGVNGVSCQSEGIAFGDNVDIATFSDRAIAIGNAISIGNFVPDSITIGTQTDVTGNSAIAIGRDASATASQAVAIGRSVVAAKAETVTVKKLETLDPGEGVIMHSPNGTEYKVTVSDAGAIVVTAV